MSHLHIASIERIAPEQHQQRERTCAGAGRYVEKQPRDHICPEDPDEQPHLLGPPTHQCPSKANQREGPKKSKRKREAGSPQEKIQDPGVRTPRIGILVVFELISTPEKIELLPHVRCDTLALRQVFATFHLVLYIYRTPSKGPLIIRTMA